MNTTDFRTAMKQAGATDQQLNTKVYQMAEQVVADGAVDGLAVARMELESFEQRLHSANDSFARSLSQAESMNGRLKGSINAAQGVCNDVDERMKELGVAADEISVKDPLVRDAINAYTLVLMRTKQVFGDDNMTESVMEKAIEAASYGMWSSIMGPKEADNQPQKKSARTWL